MMKTRDVSGGRRPLPLTPTPPFPLHRVLRRCRGGMQGGGGCEGSHCNPLSRKLNISTVVAHVLRVILIFELNNQICT